MISRKMEIPKDKYMKGHRVKLYPTPEQKEFLNKCIDVDRAMYNWGIEQQNKQYEEYLNGNREKATLNLFDMSKKYTKLRSTTPWLSEIPHATGKSGLIKLSYAYDLFFKKVSRKPRFKSKKNLQHNSFYTRSNRVYFDNDSLKIEGLSSKIKIKFSTEKIKFREIIKPNKMMYRFYKIKQSE